MSLVFRAMQRKMNGRKKKDRLARSLRFQIKCKPVNSIDRTAPTASY
jgi:hypothetical protein